MNLDSIVATKFTSPRVGGVGRVDAVTKRHRRGPRRGGGVSRALRPQYAALTLAALALSACVATQDPATVQPSAPGFVEGIWHGFIFPVAWAFSLFMDDISVYAVPNNGGWYDFGFFLGIVVFGVGANGARRHRR